MTTTHPSSNSAQYTEEDLTDLISESSHLPEAELLFALEYIRYYKQSHTKIIPTQLYRSTKYALIIAHVAVALNPAERMDTKAVGDLVAYSFASVWEGFKPDPADYDINLLRGAVILRTLGYFTDVHPRSPEGAEIGECWEPICAHWGHLQKQQASYLLNFARNLKNGGALSLSSGAL